MKEWLEYKLVYYHVRIIEGIVLTLHYYAQDLDPHSHEEVALLNQITSPIYVLMAKDLKGMEKMMKPALEKFMKDSGFVKKDVLDKLEKRVSELERSVKDLNN